MVLTKICMSPRYTTHRNHQSGEDFEMKIQNCNENRVKKLNIYIFNIWHGLYKVVIPHTFILSIYICRWYLIIN